MSKDLIRKINKQKRSSMNKTEVQEKSRRASELFLAGDIYAGSRVLMLYMPLGNEADTSLIFQRALADGKKIVLPVTDIQNNDIIPYYVDSKTKLESGAFSISEPVGARMALVSDIDTIVVPGIAFSYFGERVGFGKGFYDRFLACTDAIKVGFCYDFQLCNSIGADKHDIAMDYIVSECGIFNCKNNAG